MSLWIWNYSLASRVHCLSLNIDLIKWHEVSWNHYARRFLSPGSLYSYEMREPLVNNQHVRLWSVTSEKDKEDGRSPSLESLVYMHGEGWQWAEAYRCQKSEDIGHPAQGTAGAEPEECARLSFQHSGSDSIEALGFNEILWAESAFQLPCSFSFLALHMLFLPPGMPFAACSSLGVLIRTFRTWAWWWFWWSHGSVSKPLHLCPHSCVSL